MICVSYLVYANRIWYMQTLSWELYVPLTWSRMHVLVCVDTAPLGGKGIHFSTDKTVAYLNFENDRTAQRAEQICRAAAAAVEKNMRGNTVSGSDTPLLSNPPQVSLMCIHNSIYTHTNRYEHTHRFIHLRSLFIFDVCIHTCLIARSLYTPYTCTHYTYSDIAYYNVYTLPAVHPAFTDI